jgi:two-component system sensor histidine kinase YesM
MSRTIGKQLIDLLGYSSGRGTCVKQLMYKQSFRKRIWVSFVCLIVLSIMATGTATYYIAASAMQKNAFENSQTTISKSSQAVDEKLKNILVVVLALMFNDSFKNTVKDANLAQQGNYYFDLNALQNVFDQMKMNEPIIDSVLFSTPIGDFYPTNQHRTTTPFTDTSLYKRLQEKEGVLFVESHEDPLFMENERVISMVIRALPYIDVTASNMYIVINIKDSVIMDYLTKDIKRSFTHYELITNEGKPIVGSQLELPWQTDPLFLNQLNASKSGYFDYTANDKDYLVTYAKLSVMTDWMVVGVQSKDDLLSNINAIKWVVLLIIAGCAVIALVLSNVLTGFLLKPLRMLQAVIKQVGQNNLSVRFHSPYQDEVSHVGYQFNRMLDEIGGLIHEVEEVGNERRKAEVKALQAQIDPHFLYNTLNTMFWKAELNKNDDVKEMILSLSSLFKLGLNNGMEITTLEKELNHVTEYLRLQTKCYPGTFEYSVECEDNGLLRLPVLKLLLQPLVENSILHGFKNRQGGGTIAIRVTQQDDKLVIVVTDNGAGMDAELVFRGVTDPTQTRTSYALRNVYHRLLLYYHNEAQLQLASVPNQATMVTLTIPLEITESIPTGLKGAWIR